MSNTKKTTYLFQSETKELMNLMIHSLYSNKEVFLRELISNASDAIDKLKYLQLTSSAEIVDNKFEIKILIDKKNQQMTISDNGIGMNKKELIENLGTIAKSGTKNFLKSLKKENLKTHDLIGNFGVGFYSSFIISNQVTVYTKNTNNFNDTGFVWKSLGLGDYTISTIEKKERGTSVLLDIKDNETIFLEKWKIKEIINKYSDHINIPIKIKVLEKNKKEEKKWKQVNTAQSLWTKNQSEITETEYKNFYKHITKDSNDPIVWSHNKVEGDKEYISLIYIPKIAPWDIWNRDNKKGLKLYVKRVFIMDKADYFLPNYLRFVRGLIDSNDLPLNISREMLQSNTIITSLKKALTKRTINVLTKLINTEKNKYIEFWKQFGSVLKEGPAEDPENRKNISNLLLFSSINSKEKECYLSLKDYIKNMKPNQEKIYFITADSYESAINSPLLEVFKENFVDVLILHERIDEWMMNYLTEFENKKFQSVSKADDSLEKLFSSKKTVSSKLKENFSNFIKKIKEILGKNVQNVRITYRLTSTPAVLLTDENQMSTQMEKLFLSAGQKVPPVKYILEINPNHALIKKIHSKLETKDFDEWIKMLFSQTLLIEKGTLKDPNSFISTVNKFLSKE